MNYVGCNYFGGDLYFRQYPGVLLAVTTSTSSSTSIPTLPSSSSPSTLPTETGTSLLSSPTFIAASQIKQNKASKAWVAGVVVGAVALIAIAGMAFWMLRLRKRHTQQAYQQAPQVAQGYIQQPYVESYAIPPNAVSSLLSTQFNAKSALTPSSEQSQVRESFQHDPQTNSWYKPVTTPPVQATVPIDGTIPVQTSPPREMNSVISPVTNELPELVDGSHIRK